MRSEERGERGGASLGARARSRKSPRASVAIERAPRPRGVRARPGGGTRGDRGGRARSPTIHSMNAGRRALWVSAVLSIAGTVLAAASLTVSAVLLLDPADRQTPELASWWNSQDRWQLFFSLLWLFVAISCVAQPIRGEPWAKGRVRPVSGRLVGIQSAIAAVAGILAVSIICRALARSSPVAPTHRLRLNLIDDIGLALGIFSVGCSTLATQWFVRWWQSTPRGEAHMRSRSVSARASTPEPRAADDPAPIDRTAAGTRL